MVQLKEPDASSDGRHDGVHRLQNHDHAAVGDDELSPTEQEEAEERAALLRFVGSLPTFE